MFQLLQCYFQNFVVNIAEVSDVSVVLVVVMMTIRRVRCSTRLPVDAIIMDEGLS